ncbi:MAG TPA: carboxypeptidase-like regulatory domain-containing protein [Bacteroidia bacterium]|nr:carboxypeptidase-like regulatory domain-containing protein [Bacteroidia bacterium]
MIRFEHFYKNFFDTKNISDDRLKKFAEHHLGALTANNSGGMFTTLLNDTNTAYNNYFGKISDEDINFAVQQSLTMSADNLIRTFKETVSRKEGLIASTFGTDSPAYQEFFPLGLTEYRHATKANVELLMNRMVSAANAHSAELGAPLAQLFTDILSNYGTARTNQLGKKGAVSANKTATKGARTALEIQLLKNIFYVGFQFAGDVERCTRFFDQSIIRYRIRSASDGKGRVKGIVTGNGIPLPAAVIEFADVKVRRAKSKAEGNFRTPNVATGMRILKVSHPKFKMAEFRINVVDKGDTPLDVNLLPAEDD